MFTFTLGALCALLAYLASVLLASGLRQERSARIWRLLDQRQPFYLDALTDISLDPLLTPHLLTAVDASVRVSEPNLDEQGA